MEVFSQFTWVSDRDFSERIRGLKLVKITDANCIPISNLKFTYCRIEYQRFAAT